MPLFVLIFTILFASFAANAGYSVLLDGAENPSNSILAVGSGNNYDNLTLEELADDSDAYGDDPALGGFLDLLERFKNNPEMQGVDARLSIKRDTKYSAIRPSISFYNGSSGIVFFRVDGRGGTSASFTPLKKVDGKWEIGSDLLSNANLMAVATIYINYGRQIRGVDAQKYMDSLGNEGELKHVLAVPISLDRNLNSFIILKYVKSGPLLDSLSGQFGKMLNAFSQDRSSFCKYWGPEEGKNIRQYLDENNADPVYTAEAGDIALLKRCQKGYTVLGASEFSNFMTLYVLDETGNFDVFYAKKFHDGIRFVKTTLLDGCTTYVTCLFESPEFRDAFLRSNILSNVSETLKQASGILDGKQ